MKAQPKRFKFFNWDESATGDWSVNTGLHRLRDDSPKDLAEWLWPNGIYVQQSAVSEFLAHSNYRKAAELVRALVDAHPERGMDIREQYGHIAPILFDAPLKSLPRSPSDYPLSMRVTSAFNRMRDFLDGEMRSCYGEIS